MADGTPGLQDAEIRSTESQKPNSSEKPPQVDASENKVAQKPIEASKVETQARIEEIDQELKQVDSNRPKAEVPGSTTPSDLEAGKSITEEHRQDKANKSNFLAKESRLLNLLFKSNVIGKENLEAIPQGKNVIIVTTHNNDSDVGLAINALSERYKNITVAEESTHYILQQDPVSNLGRILHSKSAFRVDYNSGTNDRRGKFDPDNFKPMKKSLEEGKPLVMAAYFTPNYLDTANGMPERAGNGAAYLAQISKDTIILPVAVDVKLDKPVLKKSDNNRLFIQRILKGRVNADIIIGKPFVPDHIEKIERLGEVLEKRKIGAESLTEEEKQEYSSLRKQLQGQSGIIMQRLAELLPPEKRGVWGKK